MLGVIDLNGSEAERRAETFLKGQDLVLVKRNYRCRFGEIDLVMRDGVVLVFVEVRMRARSNFGGAGSSITLLKQRKLICTAQHYLASEAYRLPCRFDAVLLSGHDGERIEWIRNAFEE